MKVLLDTHLLIWARTQRKLPERVEELLGRGEVTPILSLVSVWEVAIKARKHPQSFPVTPSRFRDGFLNAGYEELEISSRHVLEVWTLPPHHNDPFDRLLIAQARAEGIPFLTADRVLTRYGDPVELV